MDHSWESIASSGPATKVATVPRGAPPVTVAKGGLQTGHVKACHIAKGDRPKVTVTKGDNVAHVKACQDADCVRCRYLRNRGAWRTKLPIDKPGHRCTFPPLGSTTTTTVIIIHHNHYNHHHPYTMI